MTTASVLGFLTVLTLVYVVPGPDFAVILRHALRAGSAGRAAALGVLTGGCLHITAALLGLSALLTRSAEAFTVVKLVGAAYLLLLGVHALYAALRRRRDPDPAAEPADDRAAGEAPPRGRGQLSLRRTYAQGFLTNVLNPKAVLFFASLMPQFLNQAAPVVPQILLYGGATIVLGLGYWSLVVLVAGRIRGVLDRPRVRRWLDGVTGLAFIGFGLRLIRTQAP